MKSNQIATLRPWMGPLMGIAGLLAVSCTLSCSGDSNKQGILTSPPPGGTVEWVVETSILPGEIAAGETAVVTCDVRTRGGSVVDTPTRVQVAPADGVRVGGHTLQGHRVGTYDAWCETTAAAWIDPTPAVLKVRAGSPAVVEAIAPASELDAGASMDIECLVFDAYGNPLTEFETKVLNQPGLPADGKTVTGDAAGQYEVHCALTDFPGKKGAGIRSIPASVEVIGGDPVTLELVVKPDQPVYARGEQVVLSWVVRDEFGNALDGFNATLEAPSTGVKNVGPLTYEFVDQGLYLFRVSLLSPYEFLTDSAELLVDDSPPELTVDWPARGEMIQGNGQSPVVVTGTLTDASGIASFTIGGDAVALDEDGGFAHPVPPRWGLNLLEIEAEDTRGEAVRITPTFYYSTSYLPYDPSGAADVVRLDNSATLLLSQQAFDDGVHDPAHLNDFATIFGVALQLIDLNALIPSLALPPLEFTLPNVLNFEFPGALGGTIGVQGDLSVSVSLGAPQFGPPDVALDTRDGGIDMTISVGDDQTAALLIPLTIELQAPVTVTVTIPSLFGGPDIVLPFELVGTSTIVGGFGVQDGALFVAIDSALEPGGTPILAVSDSMLDASGIRALPIESAVLDFGTIDLPLIGAIPIQVDLVQIAPQLFDLVELLALDPLWSLVEPLLSDTLTPLVSAALEGIAQPLVDALQIDAPIPLPLLGDPNKTVDLQLSMAADTVAFSDDGGQFGLGVGFSAPKGISREPLGLPLRAGCLATTAPAWTPAWGAPIEMSGRIDVANGLLFALWWSGAMDEPLDLSGLAAGSGIPLDGLVITPEFYLPPVLSDCEAAGSQIQVGDMYMTIDAEVFGLSLVASVFFDAAMGAELVAGPDGWSMVLGEFERLDLEVIEVQSSLGGLFDIESLISEQLLPFLTDSLPGTTLGPIALPPLDLGSIAPGLPPNLAIEFGDYSIPVYPGRASLGMAMK